MSLPDTPTYSPFVVWIIRFAAFCLPAAGAACCSGDDWPHFLGPHHTGVCDETGLNLDWNADSPKVIWKQKIGKGYSAPSVVGERIYTHFRDGGNEVVRCSNTADGAEVWSHTYPSAFSDPYGYNNGPRCSPLIRGDQCITLGAEGHLACLNAADGTVRWEHRLAEKFDLPEWFFGVGCSPVTDGDRLYVLAGGQPNSGVVCFSLSSGEVLWQAVGKETWDGFLSTNDGEPYQWTGDEMVVSYASPIISEIHGQKHLLCLVRQGLVSLDPDTGRTNFRYWFRADVHESVNAARPVVVGDTILLSAAYRVGSALVRVAPDGRSCSEVWRSSDNLLAHWSTPVHRDGFVYGFSGRHENEGELRCIRLSDGEVMWQTAGFEGSTGHLRRNRETGEIVDIRTEKVVPYPYFGRGSLITVQDRLLILGERGTLAVAHPDPREYREDCRIPVEGIGYPAWAAPVISSKRLYLRSEDWLVALDLSAEDESK